MPARRSVNIWSMRRVEWARCTSWPRARRPSARSRTWRPVPPAADSTTSITLRDLAVGLSTAFLRGGELGVGGQGGVGVLVDVERGGAEDEVLVERFIA